ncbi:MAG: MFS transporter [Burkholderiaceae bacterium]
MSNSDTPDSKNSRARSAWVIATLSAGNFAIGMGAFIVIGIITPLSSSLGMSNLQAGLVLTVYSLAYAVGSPLLVAITSELTRLRVLSIGLGLFLLGALISASAETSAVLYGARVIAALGAGLFTPVTSVVAMALVEPAKRGKALARVFLGFTLAQVFGVPIGSFIAYTYGWQTAFLLVALLSALCLIGVRFLVPAGLRVQANSLSVLWQTMTNWPAMNAVLFTASYIGCNYILITLMAPLLESSMGYSRDGVTLLLIFYGVGTVLGNILGGFLTDRIGPRRSLLIASISQILFLPMYSLLPMPDALLLAITIGWSTFGWSFLVPQQARLLSAAPQSQSVVLALNAAAVYVGASVGSTLAGIISDVAGLDLLGLAAGLFAVFGLLHLLYSEHLLRPDSR